jgi:hypothetical protein
MRFAQEFASALGEIGLQLSGPVLSHYRRSLILPDQNRLQTLTRGWGIISTRAPRIQQNSAAAKHFFSELGANLLEMTTLTESDKSRPRDTPPQTPVLAWLSPRDFVRARRTSGFSRWSRHREFLQERDALFVGYGLAGISAHMQRVPFAAFERWSRLTGAPLDIDGIDEFAAHWRWRTGHPQAPVIGRFGAPGDPERHAVDAAGAQCVLIRPEVYVRWRDDYATLGLLAPPGLDDYAMHVVECCVASRRSRRAAVNSSKGSTGEFDERE